MTRKASGRSPLPVSRGLLLRRIDTYCEHSDEHDIETIIHHLLSCHQEYKRVKSRPFSDQVRNLLQSCKNYRPRCASSSPQNPNTFDEGFRSSAKKLKKDESDDNSEVIPSSRLASRRKPEAYDELSDAVYEEEMEPEFDLTRSILRQKYSKITESKVTDDKLGVAEEVEKTPKKICTVQGDQVDGKQLENESGVKGSGSGVAKVNNGPTFRDIAGLGKVIEELKMEVIVPLYHPQLPQFLGVKPISGILLHGPPGCGKTKLAHAIANEAGIPFYQISATEVVSGVSGAAEESIRELFVKAYRTAPSVVFIDEIDAIASARDNLQRETDKRMVTQLMTCMDELHRPTKPAKGESESKATNSRPGYVLVIGATNRPDAVDRALRRPGRFDREIILGVPDENARAQILSVLTRDLRLEGSFDHLKIARSTPGFVGADLVAVANMAGNLALKRIMDRRKSELVREHANEEHPEEWWQRAFLPEEMNNLSITMTDFEDAVKKVQPSSLREGFSTIPNVKWEDVGGLDTLRREFYFHIVRHIQYQKDYEELGMDLDTGFLLWGPPGCGKTLIAKAVANEAGANFIHIRGPELLNKYVGESELAVRKIFSRARSCSPCIVFFDEVDALAAERGKDGGWVADRLLNQLLIELDGAEKRRGVFVIGATNRIEVMDSAILRPGRFGTRLYVPLPSPDERGLILKALSRKKPIDASVDLIAIGKMEACDNMSGADLAALMHEAAMAALQEKHASSDTSSEATPLSIKIGNFEQALNKVSPSVSEKQRQYYDALFRKFWKRLV